MNKVYLFLFSLLLVAFASCKNETKQEVYNPFATPEGCVKEYLAANDSSDVARMLRCYSYEPKYETRLREHLQEQLYKKARDKSYYTDSYYRNDSVKLKETYPNSAVVTVYYSHIYTNDAERNWSDSYDLNVVKDSTNWKLEVRIEYSITAN